MTNEHFTAEASAAESAPQEADLHAQTILSFIEWVVPKIPETQFTERYRMTHHGLFALVSEEPALLKWYHQWCAETSRPTGLSDEKTRRKLFGPEQKRFFLHEGKLLLDGYIVACPIPDPQRFRVAFHLGSPSAAADKLIPQDPLFRELAGLELISTRGEDELRFTLESGVVRFPLASLPLFQRICGQSKKVSERFPDLEKNVSDGVRALHAVLTASHPVKLADEPVQPLRFENRRQIRCVGVWGFYLYCSGDGRVQFFYHEYGRNLVGFLKQELGAALARKGPKPELAFDLARKPGPVLAHLLLHNRKVHVEWRAFASFVREVVDTPALWPDDKTPRNFITLLHAFSRIISRADPIDRSKIAGYVGKDYRNNFRFVVNEMWLFVVSPQWLVVDCIARVSRNREEKHSHR